MDRRELLKMIAVLTGGAVIGAEAFLTGCTTTGDKTGLGLSAGNIKLLDEIGETILPTTGSPGAKAAKIGEFMRTIVTDCYDVMDQKSFTEGIDKLQAECKKQKGKSFLDCSPAERQEFLVILDKEAKETQQKRTEFDNLQKSKETAAKARGDRSFEKEKMPAHYFTLMKQLTLWGYFTSEDGMRKALQYVPVPGRYDGCTDYKKGDKVIVGLGG
ncbi:MAG TPA: gluconate 2-dehydrogenase subunit 3 family protein [Chitinophagaceae bacterium]|jgi:hypothetical protein|nr:gluconate 2-dehydrogenase subunit 3 family protein [Chitinophagaceae bacterium]